MNQFTKLFALSTDYLYSNKSLVARLVIIGESQTIVKRKQENLISFCYHGFTHEVKVVLVKLTLSLNAKKHANMSSTDERFIRKI